MAPAGEWEMTQSADAATTLLPGLGTTQVRTTILPRRQGDGAAVPAPNDLRFHQVRALGAGGMGEVSLALDGDIHRKVAIKRLRRGTLSDGALLRFADEVRIIGQLEHPGIVPVHDVGVDDEGHVFLVMKYVEGDTLEAVLEGLRRRDPALVARYPVARRVEILAKILDALAYAHARGYVHRDLKPANVMVGPHGEVTLMDWGIAKRIGTADEVDPLGSTAERSERLVETHAGSILGTPLYMSPEQAAGRNQELDARSDVFAASILAVELLTLRHPLEGLEGLPAILATLLHHDLSKDTKLAPWFMEANAPITLFWFCVDGLARDPAARYADGGAMRDALEAVLEGHAGVRCPVSLLKRTVSALDHFVDRHPRIATFGFLGLSVATVGAVGAGVVFGVRALLGA